MKKILTYLRYLKPVKGQLTIALLMGVVFGISRGFGIPYTIKVVFPQIFQTQGGAISQTQLALYCLLPAGIALLQGLSNFTNVYFINVCGLHLLKTLRLKTFEKLQQLPIAFFHKNPPGELIARSMQDTSVIQGALIQLSMDMFRHPTTLIGAVGYLVYLCIEKSDVAFLLIFLMAVPLCVFPIRIFGRRLRQRAYQMQEEVALMTQQLNESLSGYKEVRAFNMEAAQRAQFAAQTDRFTHFQLKVVRYGSFVGPIVELIAAFGIGFSLFYTYEQGIAFDEFSSLCLALYLCYSPIKELGRLNSRLQEGIASLDRLESVLNEPITIQDPENPLKIESVKGAFSFKNVSFAYDKALFKGLNLDLEAGKQYAIVGPSGAGKSSFVSLMSRFYDPQEGSITLDGIPITSLRVKDLRAQIAMVFQDAFLFDMSIYENILLGRPDASRDAVIDAARNAYAHDFIESLEKGYETQVGPRGGNLSGGQRQRIALARAFLRDAPILILDEATASLDAESERFIQKALQNLPDQKTTFIIAHRLSTIERADRILLFDQGKLVDQGPHEDLLQRCQLYQNLYRSHQSFSSGH